MEKKHIILGVIILILVGLLIFKPFEKIEEFKVKKETEITSLKQYFPSKETKFKYKSTDNEFDVDVLPIEEENDKLIITTESLTEDSEGVIKIHKIFEVSDTLIRETKKYLKNDEVISVEYEKVVLNGLPYEGMTWTSEDNLITYEVTSMKANKVAIESVREMDVYELAGSEPIKKEYKETRVFEKGKGLVLYKTEIIGEESTIFIEEQL